MCFYIHSVSVNTVEVLCQIFRPREWGTSSPPLQLLIFTGGSIISLTYTSNDTSTAFITYISTDISTAFVSISSSFPLYLKLFFSICIPSTTCTCRYFNYFKSFNSTFSKPFSSIISKCYMEAATHSLIFCDLKLNTPRTLTLKYSFRKGQRYENLRSSDNY